MTPTARLRAIARAQARRYRKLAPVQAKVARVIADDGPRGPWWEPSLGRLLLAHPSQPRRSLTDEKNPR
jgi:hypothetical protein